MKIHTSLLALATALLAGATLNAQTTLLQYAFDSETRNPTTEATDISGSQFTHSVTSYFFFNTTYYGASSPSANVAGNQNENWSGSSTYDAGKYYTFTLTVDSGTFDLNEVSFVWNHSDNGPQTWELRSDLDDFGTSLGSNTVVDGNTSVTPETITLSSAFDNVTGSVEFRIYGYNATYANGQGFRIDDVTVSGVAIPEPSSYAMLAGGLCLALITLKRKKRLN